MPAQFVKFLDYAQELLGLGKLANYLIQRVPPALVRFNIVGDSSARNQKTEFHNNWSVSAGQLQTGQLYGAYRRATVPQYAHRLRRRVELRGETVGQGAYYYGNISLGETWMHWETHYFLVNTVRCEQIAQPANVLA